MRRSFPNSRREGDPNMGRLFGAFKALLPLLFCLSWSEANKFSVGQLMDNKFPYADRKFDDMGRYPCKAPGFLEDMALTEEDASRFRIAKNAAKKRGDTVERCCSFVGKRNSKGEGSGAQAISIGKNCDKFGIVVHELGHVIGFWHEHTRPDRDEFVDIRYQHIEHGLSVGQDYNFEKLKEGEINSLDEKYDFGSIMHYAKDTFAKGRLLDTIVPKRQKDDNGKEYTPRIGQRDSVSKGDERQARLLYNCPKCHHTIIASWGSIVWPRSKNDILEAADEQAEQFHCVWRLFASPGETISLNLTTLDLVPPPMGNCTNERENYMIVRDGHFKESPILEKICGSVDWRHIAIVSKTDKLWLEFRSNQHVKKAAKTMKKRRIRKLPSYLPVISLDYRFNCGGKMTLNVGEAERRLYHPGYPELYRNQMNCIWEITVLPDNFQAALAFEMFETEEVDDCQYDYVRFYEGHAAAGERLEELTPILTDENNRLKPIQEEKFCVWKTRERQPKPPTKVISSGNKMTINFISDHSTQARGFIFRIVKEVDECALGTSGCEHICVNTLGSFYCKCHIGFELHVNERNCEAACGGYMKGINGTITSPSFPLHYPPRKLCIWEIHADDEFHRITLNFTHFDLEGVEGSCEYDSVTVFSLAENSTTKDINIVHSHGTFCGPLEHPPLITSKTNKLRLEFSSDASVHRTGFAAVYFSDFDECSVKNGGCQQLCHNTIGSYRCECHAGYFVSKDGKHCKEGSCQHQIKATDGRLASPNFPNKYPVDKDCSWFILTTAGHRVKLTFTVFKLEMHKDCNYDYVAVFDGSATEGRMMDNSTLCTPQQTVDRTEPLISTSNAMTVKFHSDTSVTNDGFQAHYTTVCGGELAVHREVGKIFSHASHGGGQYNPTSNCHWLLRAPVGSAVALEFIDFTLEEERNCDYDSVQVFNGDSKTAQPITRKLCGKEKPELLISSDNTMTVVFQSDDTVEDKGFEAHYWLASVPEATPAGPLSSTQTTRPPLEPVINEHDGKKLANCGFLSSFIQ